jgi:hypothetical protein
VPACLPLVGVIVVPEMAPISAAVCSKALFRASTPDVSALTVRLVSIRFACSATGCYSFTVNNGAMP